MRTFLNPQKETRRHNIWLIREIKLSQKFPSTPVSYIFQRQYRKKKKHTQLFFGVFKIFEQRYSYSTGTNFFLISLIWNILNENCDKIFSKNSYLFPPQWMSCFSFCVCYFVAVTCGRHGKRISRFAVATEPLTLITFMSFSQTGVLHKSFTRWDAGCRW